MRQVNFTQGAYSKARPMHPFTVHGCPDMQTFQEVHQGEFCELPADHEPCPPGFRPYRMSDGRVIGLSLD